MPLLKRPPVQVCMPSLHACTRWQGVGVMLTGADVRRKGSGARSASCAASASPLASSLPYRLACSWPCATCRLQQQGSQHGRLSPSRSVRCSAAALLAASPAWCSAPSAAPPASLTRRALLAHTPGSGSQQAASRQPDCSPLADSPWRDDAPVQSGPSCAFST